jgi:hypothetical protein
MRGALISTSYLHRWCALAFLRIFGYLLRLRVA